MIERILVEYWFDGQWTWSRDYPATQEEAALEHGRDLWRRGVAGVRVSKFERRVLVEEKRSRELGKPRPTGTTTQPPSGV